MIKQLNTQIRAVVVRAISFVLISALMLMPLSATAVPEEVAAAEITPFEAMTLTVRRLPTTYMAAATGFLDPGIELPVTIEIAVPEGSSIIWFGEPSGERSIVSDPRFEEPFNMRTEGGFDIYTATLENYPQVQIEYNLFFSPVAEAGDGSYTLRMEYTPLTDLEALRFITNLPAGSQVLDEDIEEYGPNEEGEPQYGRTFREVRGGRMYATSLSYTAPRWQGMPIEGNIADGLIITAVAVIAGVAVALTFIIITKRRRAATEWEEEEWEDEEE